MSERKPIVGVIPLWDDERRSIWMLPGYMDLVRESGAVPIILPLKVDRADLIALCDMCDGFLLTGGHDVNPSIYDEPIGEKCGLPNDERDSLERIVFEYAVERDRPLFGICRGIQLINALCGGTLYQDLPTEFDSKGVNHQMTPPYDQPTHRVEILPETPLSQILNTSQIEVNSYHHQAIKEISPQLSAMAISEDGLVEAIYMPNKRFIQAVQWHPEFNYLREDSSRLIFRAFIEASRSAR